MSSAVPRKTTNKADCCCQFIKYLFYRRRGFCLREKICCFSQGCAVLSKTREFCLP